MSTIMDGLSLGAIYALIALGYTMVYGIAKMLNFAHGDIIMVGAYAILTSLQLTGNPYLAVVVSILVCTASGVIIERLAYKPLRGASPLAVLITAIGVSFFLQAVAQLVKKTRTGRAMQAVSEDKGAALLMGINVNRIIMITFAIGSMLAAFASLFYLMQIPSITPTLGSMPGIKAFTAAVIGGIGSIPGAMLGGVLLGLIEKICLSIPVIAPYTTSIEFSLLIVILLVKPIGLLGKKIREKV